MTTPALSPKQIDAFKAAWGSRVTIYDGSIRSGKSHTWLLVALAKIANYNTAGAIVLSGKNIDTIYRNVFGAIETTDTFASLRPHIKYRQGATTATIFGQTVHIIGADDILSEGRIRGMSIGLALVDEITLTHPNYFAQLLGRMSPPGAQLIGTTNPDSPCHWLRQKYLRRIPNTPHFDPDTPTDKQLTNWSIVHFTMDDNPSLTSTYRTSIRNEYTGLWYDRFIRGLWVAAEGAVFDMWNPDNHVVPHHHIPTELEPIALGLDYGTTNPTHGTLLQLDPHQGNLYITHEFTPTRGTDSDLANQLDTWLADKPHPRWIYLDPAAASFYLELYHRGHHNTAHADNNVLNGIRTISSLLAQNKLHISDQCTKLIQEISEYKWDDKATAKGEDKPVKQGDHGIDSMRYGTHSTQTIWDPYIRHQETTW